MLLPRRIASRRSIAARAGRRGAAALAVACAMALPSAGAAQFSLNGMALGAGNATVGVRSFQSLRFAQTIHQKYDFSCGSAALATLLTYAYDHPVSEHDVFISMFRHGDKQLIEREGFSLLDMKNYLARRGIPSGGFDAPLAKLAALRVSAIVLINDRGYHHFVVLRSIQDGHILISDPALGTRTEDVARFRRQWSGIFFLILSQAPKAQANFDDPALWRSAPPSPTAIARYALTLSQLQQVTILQSNRF